MEDKLYGNSKFAKTDSLSPVLPTLEILQGKWTLHIIHSLLPGKKRFNEIMTAVGVNPRTLSARLKEMEASGIVSREFFPEVPPRVEYRLTAKGEQLGDLIKTMSEWGARWRKENDDYVRSQKKDEKKPAPKNDFMFLD